MGRVEHEGIRLVPGGKGLEDEKGMENYKINGGTTANMLALEWKQMEMQKMETEA